MGSEVIALKNEQPIAQHWQVTLADIEAAVPQALTHSSFFFSEQQTWELWRQSVALFDRLVQQELLEPTPQGYQFQVELICDWFVAYRDNL